MEICAGIHELLNYDNISFNNTIPQWIFGVVHDDYNYHEIDQVLDQNFKELIKHWCNKQQSSAKIFQTTKRKLSPTENVQVSILVMEARFQSELLYVFKAVMKHMAVV